MEEYRVLLADDEEEIRTGISRKIDWAALGFALVGEAGNGEEALELAEQLRPDVVLTDIKMPFLDGLELCRRLRVSLPGARLVVFSGFDDFEYARQAVSMGVSEYILKPINAPELTRVLETLRDQLDRQRLERRDMETLRRRYEESLPVLRELFYTRLLSGQIRPEQVQDRAARYEIDLPQGLWTAALVHVDGDEGERDELLLLSVQSFLEKHFALAGCAARVVLYGDMAALLVHLDREDRLYPLLEELERLSRLSQSYLGFRLTTGVGLPCRGPEELNHSAAGARSALDYRVLAGGGRVIYIGDQEPLSAAAPSFEEEDQRALSAAVKLGTPEQTEAVVRELMCVSPGPAGFRWRRSSARALPARCPSPAFPAWRSWEAGWWSAAGGSATCWAGGAAIPPGRWWSGPRTISPGITPTSSSAWRRCVPTSTSPPRIFPPCLNGR